MTNTEDLDGFRKDRYFARSWAMLTQEKGWWKPVVLCALACLVPIVGPLAVLGYELEWSRRVSWGSTEAPARHVSVGDLISSGWRGFVALLGWAFVGAFIGQILPLIPIIGDLLSALWVVALIFLGMVVMVCAVRATIYQSFKAGYRVETLWAMASHDPWGLMRIWLMRLVIGIVEKVVALIVILPSLLGTVPYFVRLFGYVDAYYYYIDDYEAFELMLDALGYFISHVGGALIAVLAIALLVKCFSGLLTYCSLGLWMRQFDVPAWGKDEDPLPETAFAEEKPSLPPAPPAPVSPEPAPAPAPVPVPAEQDIPAAEGPAAGADEEPLEEGDAIDDGDDDTGDDGDETTPAEGDIIDVKVTPLEDAACEHEENDGYKVGDVIRVEVEPFGKKDQGSSADGEGE